MGIHDRGWYRDESSGWGRAGEHRGVILLIAITVACTIVNFVVPQPPQPRTDEEFAQPVRALQQVADFHPVAVLQQAQVWRLATSFFIDASVFGLIFGMLGLYFFGGEMELLYGTGRFVVFYLLAGIIPNAAKLLLALGGIGMDVHTSGASAPLAATFVLFVFHYPHRPIRLWLLPAIPAWVLVTIYLAINVLLLAAAINTRNSGGVPAILEPLLGAVVGYIFYRTRGGVFGLQSAFGKRQKRRTSSANLKVYDEDAPRPSARPKVEEVPQPVGGGVDEHLEAKLDAVLAKVARQGRGSLTAEENAVLLQASEVFKKKRR